MRKSTKLLTVLLTLVLALSVVGIFAIAASTEAGNTATALTRKKAENDGYFVYYDKSADTFTDKENSTFEATVESMSDGDVIKLLSDLNCTTNGYIVPLAAEVYIDLNGYQLSLDYYGKGAAYLFQITQASTLNFYSSDDNYTASISALSGISTKTTDGVTTESASTTIATFNLRNAAACVNIGSIDNAPVITGSNGSYSIIPKDCDGDNLNTYSCMLLGGENTAVGSTFNVKGGNHYHAKEMSTDGLFVPWQGHNININLTDATFISTTGGPIFYTRPSGTSTIEADNCVFYTEGSIYYYLYNSNITEADSSIYFKNSYLYGSKILEKTNASPTFENCQFNTLPELHDGKNVLVKTLAEKTIAIHSAEQQTGSKASISKISDKTLVFTEALAASGNVTNITWTTPDNNSVTEAWLKSADVIPARAVNAQTSDVYYYDWCDENGNAISSTASGDKTYVLTPRVKFTVQANVTLYTDFVYNIYIPKSAVESASFKSIQFVEVATGETVTPVKNGTMNITGVEHYVYSKPIDATEGDAEYKLIITLNSDYGDIVKEQAFSIPDYVKRVQSGNFSDSAKAMVNATLTYIQAARNYYADVDGTKIPYENLTVSAVAKKWDKATPSDAVKDAIYGISISPDSRFKFVLYIYADKIDTVEITYRENGKFVKLSNIGKNCDDNHGSHTIRDKDTGTSVNVLCQEIALTALDVRSPIRIDISTTADINPDYSYSLANYVYSVYGDESSYLAKLLDALWAYSESCEAYVTDTDSSDTPTVEISIGEKTVDANNYVIVASNDAERAAAEKLREAIAAKTGYTLEISEAAVNGKSSIIVNLAEKPTTLYDFVAEVSGYDLVFNCSLSSYLDGAVSAFIAKHISPLNADKDFTESFKESYYTNSVYYSDFGAVGDGETDDFKAIYSTHEYANDTGKTVKADSNETYYICDTRIGGTATTVKIQTNVDWCGAKFIIDDTQIVTSAPLLSLSSFRNDAKAMGAKNIFEVIPNSNHTVTKIADTSILSQLKNMSIGPKTESIGAVIHEAIGGWDGPLMIILYDSTHQIYRRSGYNQSADTQEIIVIEADGSISSETPIIFDYTEVTSVDVYKLDPTSAITVKNGTFTTWETTIDHLADDGTMYGGTISRGLSVSRSYTTVENIEHIVEYGFNLLDRANGYEGASQAGFFRASNANHVTFKDCVIPGRIAYGNSSSYNFGAAHVNKIVLDNCYQPNFWVTTDAEGNIHNATKYDDTAIGNAVKSDSNAIQGMGFNDLGLKTHYTNNDGKHMDLRLFWGVGGTNFCKNMEYRNSTITRFDAHQGLHTGKIINSNLMGFEIIGYGEMLVEDSAIYKYGAGGAGNALVYLRNDYGSTWDGDVIFKNVKAYHYETESQNFENGNGNAHSPSIVSHSYNNWDYGYVCHFPNIVLDNVTYWSQITGKQLTAEQRGQIALLYNGYFKELNMHLPTLSDGTTNVNPITPPDYISVINNSNGYDYESIYTTYETTYTSEGIDSFFKDTVIGIDNDNGDTPSFVKGDKKFTVTWVDGNGTALETDSVLYGATPEYNGATPTKTPTAEHSYAFVGWDSEPTFVRGNVIYKAQFDETNVTHTVTWVDEDGTVLETDENVLYGATPEYNGELPTKESTEQYTYEFAWSPEISAVTNDVTYKATFTAVSRKYTVTWVNEDGTTIDTDSVAYGETPTYDGATPTKAATAQYTYTFAGWTPNISEVKGDVTYTATFTETLRTYTVTWKNENGTVLKTDKNVAYGTTPTYDGENPTKAATAQYTYTFAGWTPSVSTVTGDVTYTAQFNSTVNTYTVIWKNADDTVLETDENVTYGTTPKYDGTTPTKAATAQYTYTFAGWTPSVSSVKGYVTYTATYTETLREYTVTYYSDDGSRVLHTETVEYGSAAPEHTATKDTDSQYSYEFDKWVTVKGGSVKADLSNITCDVNVYASFIKTARKATITIASDNTEFGSVSVSEIENVLYGETITVSGNTLTVNGETIATATAKDSTDTYTYVFNGWRINGKLYVDGTVTVDETIVVDGNIQITAEFLREKTIINVTEEKDEDAPVVPYV